MIAGKDHRHKTVSVLNQDLHISRYRDMIMAVKFIQATRCRAAACGGAFVSAVVRLFSLFRPFPGGDLPFENYYSSLTRSHPHFAPTAAEARRDFAQTRAIYDRALMF